MAIFELEKLILDALSSSARPKSGYRQALWAALEPDNDSLGHKRRVFLANLIVRPVLPIIPQLSERFGEKPNYKIKILC